MARLATVAVAAAAGGAGMMGMYLLGRSQGSTPARRELPAVAEARTLAAYPRPAPRTPEQEIAALRQAATNGSPLARSAALDSLASRDPDKARQLARRALDDPGVAGAAARVLLLHGAAEDRAVVAERLDRPGLDPAQRREVAAQLLEVVVAARAPSAELLAQRLGADSDPEMRALMTHRIGRLGPAAIERLCQPLAADPDAEVRAAAQAMLRAARAP